MNAKAAAEPAKGSAMKKVKAKDGYDKIWDWIFAGCPRYDSCTVAPAEPAKGSVMKVMKANAKMKPMRFKAAMKAMKVKASMKAMEATKPKASMQAKAGLTAAEPAKGAAMKAMKAKASKKAMKVRKLRQNAKKAKAAEADKLWTTCFGDEGQSSHEGEPEKGAAMKAMKANVAMKAMKAKAAAEPATGAPMKAMKTKAATKAMKAMEEQESSQPWTETPIQRAAEYKRAWGRREAIKAAMKAEDMKTLHGFAEAELAAWRRLQLSQPSVQQ